MFSFFKTIKSSQNVITKDILEEKLLECDIEYSIIEKILEAVGSKVSKSELEANLIRFLKKESYYDKLELREINNKPLVFLIVGVNGAGKTTTIAKIGKIYKQNSKKVIFGAGDTFRAAAVEQICAWGKKLEIPTISSKFGADPASVAFDTINAAKSRNLDIAIIDTAGRLDNKINLKNELIKISNTCKKALNGTDFYKILVLDGTQGAQAINQARIFNEAIDIDGIVITKLDGTSKGGSLISIIYELRLPILYIGIGEGEDDFIPFDIDWYLKNLIDYIF
ncbi:signal recognition particle-docking protein FtsY [Helicobacter sp. MIT 14-3879]|uniref:signal recognition particle-docking protein FtsY n=1 Tax=Helicobacter sp. MIT 14-3879 TaxID=2040649 RepID=UPI000E1E42B9|nr:signal recognition particle-docking protein FtsY [Helicobacter sp. MIT 14-3879]RDU65076.1 signal recognition particle-docking protein FtsY [Helicobacter sp. MIT 14-3879]